MKSVRIRLVKLYGNNLTRVGTPRLIKAGIFGVDAYYFLQLIEKVVFFLLFIGLFGALQVENPAFFATK